MPRSRVRGAEPQPRARWAALDDLRGLAILVMVPVNVAAPFLLIPAWFKHAPADGLTLPDFVVPAFLFSLGLSAALSFKARRQRTGLGRTFLHALIRSAVLFAFGTVGILLVDQGARWEILQMLGATGLFSFFFLLLPPWPRLCIRRVPVGRRGGASAAGAGQPHASMVRIGHCRPVGNIQPFLFRDCRFRPG